jgi:hypothetical protein
VRTIHLLLAAVLVSSCLPTPPAMVVTRRAGDFDLPGLAAQRIAVWPIAVADMAPTATEGLTAEYGTQDAFLDSLARAFSDRLILPSQPLSLRSDQVTELLAGAEATRPLLDPRQLLGDASDSRFASRPGLAALAKVPALEGIRFAVMFRDFSLARAATAAGFASTGPASPGVGRVGPGFGHAGPSEFGAGTVSWASGSLRLAVVDLGARAVVWEGTLVSYAMLGGEGLHAIEDDLSAQFAEQVFGRKLRRRNGPAPSPCNVSRDCARGTCVSGTCR